MVQNVQHWYLERDYFGWAREHVSPTKWFQILKYFPGYILRRQMVYVDAETGETITAEGGEVVPQGKVYLYAYDVRNFCGIDVPGLDDAMSATRKSRLAQRTTPGDAPAGAQRPAGAAGSATPDENKAQEGQA